MNAASSNAKVALPCNVHEQIEVDIEDPYLNKSEIDIVDDKCDSEILDYISETEDADEIANCSIDWILPKKKSYGELRLFFGLSGTGTSQDGDEINRSVDNRQSTTVPSITQQKSAQEEFSINKAKQELHTSEFGLDSIKTFESTTSRRRPSSHQEGYIPIPAAVSTSCGFGSFHKVHPLSASVCNECSLTKPFSAHFLHSKLIKSPPDDMQNDLTVLKMHKKANLDKAKMIERFGSPFFMEEEATPSSDTRFGKTLDNKELHGVDILPIDANRASISSSDELESLFSRFSCGIDVITMEVIGRYRRCSDELRDTKLHCHNMQSQIDQLKSQSPKGMEKFPKEVEKLKELLHDARELRSKYEEDIEKLCSQITELELENESLKARNQELTSLNSCSCNQINARNGDWTSLKSCTQNHIEELHREPTSMNSSGDNQMKGRKQEWSSSKSSIDNQIKAKNQEIAFLRNSVDNHPKERNNQEPTSLESCRDEQIKPLKTNLVHANSSSTTGKKLRGWKLLEGR